MKITELSRIVREKTGKNIINLVTEELGVRYANFQYRAKAGKIHLADYIYLSIRSGVSLDTLIMSDPRYKHLVDSARARAMEFNQGVLPVIPIVEVTEKPSSSLKEEVILELSEPFKMEVSKESFRLIQEPIKKSSPPPEYAIFAPDEEDEPERQVECLL
jgi:hypothetical protein